MMLHVDFSKWATAPHVASIVTILSLCRASRLHNIPCLSPVEMLQSLLHTVFPHFWCDVAPMPGWVSVWNWSGRGETFGTKAQGDGQTNNKYYDYDSKNRPVKCKERPPRHYGVQTLYPRYHCQPLYYPTTLTTTTPRFSSANLRSGGESVASRRNTRIWHVPFAGHTRRALNDMLVKRLDKDTDSFNKLLHGGQHFCRMAWKLLETTLTIFDLWRNGQLHHSVKVTQFRALSTCGRQPSKTRDVQQLKVCKINWYSRDPT